jgi:hypothetical protein
MSGIPPQDPLAAIPDDRTLQRYAEIQGAKGVDAYLPAQTPGPSLLSFFAAGSTGFAGMYSYPAASALQPGQWSLAENVRGDDGSIFARFAATGPVGTGIPGSASFRGAKTFTLYNGATVSQLTLIALAVSGVVRIYKFDPSGTLFKEVTATTGAYGNTRMTDTGFQVSMSSVINPFDNNSYVVIQNGTDAPRLYSTNADAVRVQNSIQTPTSQSSLPITYTFQSFVPIFDSANITYAHSNVRFEAINVGGTIAPNCATSVLIQAGTVAGDTTDLSFTAINLNYNCRQLVFINNDAANTTTQTSFWDSVKVSIYNGSVWTVIYDPTNLASYSPYNTVQTDQTELPGGAATCFSLDNIDPSLKTTVSGIRFTYALSVSPPTNYGFAIYAIFGGGKTQPGASHLVSTYNSGTLGESAGIVMPQSTKNPQVWSVGGPYANKITVPCSAGLLVNYDIPYRNVGSTDLANGVDTLRVYRKDPGATDYFLAGGAVTALYAAGTWEYTFGTQYSINHIIDAFNVDGSTLAPDAYTLTLPTGTVGVAANGRFFVGANQYVYISELNSPFRYRYLADLSKPRSAVRNAFQGFTVQGFGAATASALGQATVYVFTDKSTWEIPGTDVLSLSQPQFVAAVGCSAPLSIASYKDAIFFVDDNYQIRRFSYGILRAYGYLASHAEQLMKPISRLVVEDKIKQVPSARVTAMTGICAYDRYYLAYTPSGGSTNTKILVWDETTGCFVQDTASPDCAGMASFGISNGPYIYFPSSFTGYYVAEDNTSNSTVAVHLTSREVSAGMWDSKAWIRTGIIVDKQSGQTVSITKTTKPDNATDSSTIPVGNSSVTTGGQAYRWDTRSGAVPGISGVSCQWDLTVSMTGGTRIYSIVAEQIESTPGADVGV